MKSPISTTLDRLKGILQTLGTIISEMVMGNSVSRRVLLYQTALAYLGSDASPENAAPNVDGCADSLTMLIAKIEPTIQWTNRLSTMSVAQDMENGKHFIGIISPEPGDIIISPTGSGSNANMPHGHCGIVMEDGIIASNDSRSGLWMENYTIRSWTNYFHIVGGYPAKFFRIMEVD